MEPAPYKAPAMHRERLQREADLLLRVHQEQKRFNILTWIDASDENDPDYMDRFVQPECHTAACAIGWAMRDPWFREQGLDFVIRNDQWIEPKFDRCLSFVAVARFFGISLDAAEHLFSADGYEGTPTALDVRKAILDFMQQHQEDAP